MRFELKEKPWHDPSRASLVCHKTNCMLSELTGDIMVDGDDEYIIKDLQGDYLLVDKIKG